MEEQIFWKTMNPARLHALYSAYFLPARPQAAPELQKAVSLSEYLRGG